MKQIRKTISLLLTVIMVFSMFTIIPAVTADAASGISYIDEHG